MRIEFALAVLFFAGCRAEKEKGPSAGTARLTAEVIDLGAAICGRSKPQGEVTLINDGPGKLSIKSIVVSCGCLKAWAGDNTVPAGGKSTLFFEIDSKVSPGPRTVDAAIVFEDRSSKTLAVKVNFVPPLEFECGPLPVEIDARHQEAVPFKAVIHLPKGHSRPLEKDLQINSVSGEVAVKLDAFDTSIDDASGFVVVKVRGVLNFSSPADEIQTGELRIRMADFDDRVRVPFRLRQDARLQGGSVAFGSIPRSETAAKEIVLIHPDEWRVQKILCDGSPMKFRLVNQEKNKTTILLESQRSERRGMVTCDCLIVPSQEAPSVAFQTVIYRR